MNNFEFYNPVKIVFGNGEVVKIGEVVKAIGKKALIVSYKNIDFYGDLFDKIHKKLQENNVEYVDFLGVTANPKISEALAGIAYARQNEVDVIIGVGGGSAMDLSKIIAAGVLYPYNLGRMIRFSHSKDNQILPTKALPIVMIPTLPATGSEMNATAVITDDNTMKKSYVWEPSCLYPVCAILDPSLTLTLPAYQTACGAIDSISHALEPYLFSNESTYGNIDLQSNMQISVIKTIMQNLPKVLENPDDIQLRSVMQFSATVALNGWLTCGVQGWTPMHQMGHVLTSMFNATHGASLACMMLAWMRFFAGHKDKDRFTCFTNEIWGTSDIDCAADKFEDYISNAGVQTRISQFGCTEDDLDLLTQNVADISFSSDNTLASIPPIEYQEVYEIFRLSL